MVSWALRSESSALLASGATFSARRAERRLAMATATKKAGAVRQVVRRASAVSAPAANRYLVFEDNGGDFRWTILGSDGESLAQSGTFATYHDAQQAAAIVRDGAGSGGARAPGR
jgi:uncharacterized protein YegP (UPF0339 family)